MMKKRIGTALCALVMLFTLCAAGCKDPRQESIKPDGTQVVRVYLFTTTEGRAQLEQAIRDDFYVKHEKIEIALEPAAGKFYDKLTAQITSGTEADVFYMEPGEIWPYLENGNLEPLDKWLTDGKGVEKEDLWDINTQAYAYDGTDFGQGSIYTVIKDWTPDAMLVYNRDLMNESQLEILDSGTLTFEQFATLGKDLIQRDFRNKITRYGYLPGLGAGKEVCNFIRNAGGNWFDENGNSAFSSAAATAGVQTYYDVLKANEAHNVTSSAYGLFMNGNLAMTMTGRFALSDYNLLDMNIGVAMPPVREAGQQSIVNTTGLVGFSMSKNSIVKEAAWTFIEWYLDYFGEIKAQEGSNFQGLKKYTEQYMLNPEVVDAKTLAINRAFYDAFEHTEIIARNRYCTQAEFESALTTYDSAYLGGSIGFNSFIAQVNDLIQRTVDFSK